MLVERRQRERSEPLRRVRAEDVRAAVDSVNGLAVGALGCVDAACRSIGVPQLLEKRIEIAGAQRAWRAAFTKHTSSS